MDAKGVLALSYEGFDLQVLLQRLEEELDLPPLPADLSYGARPEPEMIGKKDDSFSCFRVLDSDPAERSRISLLHPRSGKTDDLVGKDMPVSGRSTDFLNGVDAVLLHPGDEKYAPVRPGLKLAEVHVPLSRATMEPGLRTSSFDMRLSWVFASGMETKEGM
jgi:hypothetical protein